MASVDIDRALVQAFIAANFGLPIAHENLPYSPVSGTPYVELRVLQNDTTPLNLAHTDQTDGVFRVILRYPVSSGAIAAKVKASEIFGTFRIGHRHCYGSTCVTMTGHSRQPGVAEDGWYKLIADVRYRAHLKRG